MMKYIATKTEKGVEEIFTFPFAVHHDAMAEMLSHIRNQTHGQWKRVYREPISAGFVDSTGHCHGHSETLKLKARPGDTDLLKKQLGG